MFIISEYVDSVARLTSATNKIVRISIDFRVTRGLCTFHFKIALKRIAQTLTK